MKIETIKQYSNTYYVSFQYNGEQLGVSEKEITKDTERTAKNNAHDCFIEDTNKYRSIPTPKFDECIFEILSSNFIYPNGNENGMRLYTIKVRVIWQYNKDAQS